MSDIFATDGSYMSTSSACLVDLTPPTFSGINFLDVESRGQIRVGWNAATDSNPPIRYEIYIKESTNVGLFNAVNIALITPQLQGDIFTLPDGSFLQNGSTYYVGVRALDSLGNRETNVVSMSVISTGVLTSIDVYENEIAWSVDESNHFNLTVWGNKNESLAIAPTATMGAASYQVYDKVGNPISGFSQSGVSINSNGLYVFTPIAFSIDESSENYQVKVTVSIDGEDRVNFLPLSRDVNKFKINGTCSTNNSNQIVGSFWISKNENVLKSNIGTCSLSLRNMDGSLISGFAESGIVANADGFFVFSPMTVTPAIDLTKPYIAEVLIVAEGITRKENIVINSIDSVYSTKATFSINASNEFQATLWATLNDSLVDPSLLGTASYIIYNKNGVAVAGMNQSGILSDAKGFFYTTPVDASLLTDLNHYSVKVTISVAGKAIESVKGFTLLGN